MCLNLPQAEAEHWRTRGRALVSKVARRASEFKTDPLLRSSPKLSQLMSVMQSIRISHGHMIEEALVYAINRVPGWHAEHQTKVTDRRQSFLIDCFAHHAASGTLYVFEAKRGHSFFDRDKTSAIDTRLQKATPAARRRARALGLHVRQTKTVIVSFYGAKWQSKYRIVDATEAATLFPPCAVAFVSELSRYVGNVMAEHFDFPRSDPTMFERGDDGDLHFDANGGKVFDD